MENKPSYYRARIATIADFLRQANLRLKSATSEEQKKIEEFNIVLLRNGFIPNKTSLNLEESIGNKLHHNKHLYSDDPLTFQELTTNSTWFAMHPEKVAGVEYAGTGVIFPVLMKGGKEDVIRVLKGEKAQTITDSMSDSMSEIELEALALEVELQLLSFGVGLAGIFIKPKRKIILR